MPSSTVTMLLRDWRSGDSDALEELTPLVYDDLRRIAANRLRGERAGHTLQATALVNEAFVRLSEGQLAVSDRAHFFAIAARMIRRILTDYARARGSLKRGGNVAHQTLNEDRVGNVVDVEIIDLALRSFRGELIILSDILRKSLQHYRNCQNNVPIAQ